MSIDTKGWVATLAYKEVFLATALLEGVVHKLQREVTTAGPSSSRVALAGGARVEITSNGMALVRFKLGDEDRTLHVFFDCDCDREKYAPHTLTFSLGWWGKSAEIMRATLEAFSCFGQAWFMENDADSNVVALPNSMPGYMQLARLGYQRVNPAIFRLWVQAFQRGAFGGRLAESVLGMPVAQAQQLLGLSYDDGKRALESAMAVVSLLAETDDVPE